MAPGTSIIGAKQVPPWRLFVRTWLLERTARRLPRTDAVLDLGCGWGFYFRINPRAVGIDGDPDAIAALTERGYDVRRGNLLERLPFDDGRFGFVVAHDVLEHFSPGDHRAIAAEVHRVLGADGTFVVIVPNRKGFDLGVREGVGHVTFVTRAEVEAFCEGLFDLERAYAEPLPRWLGRHFAHNKEVFLLRRRAAR